MWLSWVFTILGFVVFWFSIFPFIFTNYILAYLIQPLNLKKRYKSDWALVTGASSGIGKSLSIRLAEQGLNVVLVALDDQTLSNTYQELEKQYPLLRFVKVGVNLGQRGYLQEITKATQSLNIQVFFLNAGYIPTGFYMNLPEQKINANIEVNALSSVTITKYYLDLMVQKKQKGCFIFTSSCVMCIPTPFSVTYNCTKALISSFASSLATECKGLGIDVHVVHPSPVNTSFYTNEHVQHESGFITMFKNLADSADNTAYKILKCIGRFPVYDMGGTAIGFRLAQKLIDSNLITTVIQYVAPLMPEYKIFMQK